MVIRFVPSLLGERLSFGALTDLGDVTTPIVVGAWMTRIWLGAFGEAGAGRLTADVDVQVDSAETLASRELITLLEGRAYQRDALDYPFRMTRRVAEGARIIDLLVDRDSPSSQDSVGYPVEGLELATKVLVRHELDAPDTRPFGVMVPTLARAFVLRCLALQIGRTGLKFDDYVEDAVQVARLVRRDESAGRELKSLRATPVGERVREVMLPLFANVSSPGATAASRTAMGDRALASRQASALIQELLL